MEPYLRPREGGIDTLDIYIEGFTKFLHDYDVTDITLAPWSGSNSLDETKAVSYGSWRWLDLNMLWTTGHDRKGGLILFSL